MTISSAAGLTIFALELPTSGFADAFGRRPVFVVSAVVNVVASASCSWRTPSGPSSLAAVLTGRLPGARLRPARGVVRRHGARERRPAPTSTAPSSAQGTVLGVGIAVGRARLRWPGLVAPVRGRVGARCCPSPSSSPSTSCTSSPSSCSCASRAAPSTSTPRVPDAPSPRPRRRPPSSATASACCGPTGCCAASSSSRCSGRSAMIVFETFQPIRLAELVGGEERAGAIMGPVAAGGWARLRPRRSARRAGRAAASASPAPRSLARVLNGLGAVVMGLVAGPAALIAAYGVTYLLHGSARPGALRPAPPRGPGPQPRHRAVDELDGRLGRVRGRALRCSACSPSATSTQVAMVVAGAFSIAGRVVLPPRPAAPEKARGTSRRPTRTPDRSASAPPRPGDDPSITSERARPRGERAQDGGDRDLVERGEVLGGRLPRGRPARCRRPARAASPRR